MFKTLAQKKPTKDLREKQVLLGLIELYLKDGKPVSSNTLRENGFGHLSSATIRNYFVKLEKDGFLKQQHSSGGRTPTQLAYKLYADSTVNNSSSLQERDRQLLNSKLRSERKDPAVFLQEAAEAISGVSGCALFLSSPRFDQDFIIDIKLVGIDSNRILSVLVTDFGLVHTETLMLEKKLSSFMLKRIEHYLHFRITGLDRPSLSETEEDLGQRIYKEIMLRHIVSYNHFSSEDLYRTGFSRLLQYPDFNNAKALASGLALFENQQDLRKLLNECRDLNQLCFWIGEDTDNSSRIAAGCSVIAIPYRIHQNAVGALAILGPQRIPYRRLFGILQLASNLISETLTKSMYKFKISFREPSPFSIEMARSHPKFEKVAGCFLLEDQTPPEREPTE